MMLQASPHRILDLLTLVSSYKVLQGDFKYGIQTIRAFVAVVDYKSFSEAAKHLYLTQPTISSHIQALEKELNSRLLIRTTKQMKVTDRGMQLYECAVHMLNMRDQIIDEFAGNKWKLIDVSASTIPSSYLLPELLSEFSKYSRISIFISGSQTAQTY